MLSMVELELGAGPSERQKALHWHSIAHHIGKDKNSPKSKDGKLVNNPPSMQLYFSKMVYGY